jgi:hypothetical protein
MAFQYTPFDPSRYAGTIAELIARGGDIRARGLEALGQIQARRAEQQGQIWGGMAQNLGQIIGRIPEQLQQARVGALQEQNLRGQIGERQALTDERTQKTNDTAAIDRAFLPQSALGPGAQGPMPENAPPPTREQILANVPGHLRGNVEKVFAEADDHAAKMRASKQQADKDAREYVGFLGAQIRQSGYNPFVASLALQHAEEEKADDPVALKQVQQLRAMFGQDPQSIKRVADAAILGSSYRTELTPKLMEHDPTKNLVNPQTGEVISKAIPKEPPAKALQSKAVLVDGKTAEAVFNPTDGTWAVNGQPVDASRIKPVPTAAQVNINQRDNPPGDWAKTGDAFLETIPVQWRATVQKLANYEEDPTKVASMRGGMRETLMQWVNQVNPEYKADEFSVRAPTRKAFTTGTQGQQINAINTAIGHIDQIIEVGGQMQNGDFTPANALFNKLRSAVGSDKVTNFDTLKEALAGEVASVLSKSGATVSGIEAAKQSIKASSSPQQLAGYVKTLVPVMGSKLAAFDYQYHQAMGANDRWSALSPESKRILEKHGFDPAHPTIGTDAKTIGGFVTRPRP